jgi:hypothetical protein
MTFSLPRHRDWLGELVAKENAKASSAKAELNNDISHRDLGDRNLDSSVAHALSLRGERSGYMAIARNRPFAQVEHPILR